MTARTNRMNAGTGSRGKRPTLVWRFVDYEGRFAPTGMPADREVAQYAKWYINAWKGPGGEWLVALNRLRGIKEFIWYQGAIAELLTVAMNQSPEYQGSLVTGSKVPMTASEVGSILRVDGRRALVVLTRLEQVGILERVEWPSPGSGGDISDDQSLRLLQNVAEACRKGSSKGGRKPHWRAEKRGPPLNKSEKVEKAAAQQTVEVEVLDESPPACAGGTTGPRPRKVTCPQCGHVGKVAKAAKGWGAEAVQCTQCGHVTRQSQMAKGSTPRPSTSTSSTSPDGGVGPGKQGDHAAPDPGRQAHPVSDSHGEPKVVRMGDVLASQGHRYSAEANAFGEQVLAAMGVAISAADRANEVAHWAKLWQSACEELSRLGVERVRAKVLRIADELRQGRRRANRPCAFLERTMQNEIRDQKRAHHIQTA